EKIVRSGRAAFVPALQLSVAAKENRHRYDGSASGDSLYNYYRDYDSSLGRYLESDPIGLRGGLNTYGYVGGSPLAKLDPAGLASVPIDVPGLSTGGLGGLGWGSLGLILSLGGDTSDSDRKSITTVAQFCSKCQATDSRTQAQIKAYAWAGLSSGTGTPLSWTMFNPPGGPTFRKGPVWA